MSFDPTGYTLAHEHLHIDLAPLDSSVFNAACVRPTDERHSFASSSMVFNRLPHFSPNK